MFRLILKWGAISGGVMTGLLLLSYLLFPEMDAQHFDIAEVLGYVAIFASLAVIFLALNELDRQEDGPPATLWRKIMVGVLVSVVAGLIFGIYNVIYTSYLNPEFMDAYYAHYIGQLEPQSGPEFDRMVAELEMQKAMFMNPVTQFFVMAATVVAVGVPVSVILAAMHKFLGQRREGATV